jgi:hypothetical protein
MNMAVRIFDFQKILMMFFERFNVETHGNWLSGFVSLLLTLIYMHFFRSAYRYKGMYNCFLKKGMTQYV